MARNSNDPYGARPIMQGSGGAYGRTETYSLPVGYAKDVMVGDLVKLNGSATLDGRMPSVQLYEQGDTADILGVVVGFAVDTDQKYEQGSAGHGYFVDTPILTHYKASTASPHYVKVVTDPDVLLKMRVGNGLLVAGDMGSNADLTARTARRGAYPLPGFMVDAATKGASADLPVRLVRFSDEQDNDPTTEYAEVWVRINKHVRRTAKEGV